MLFQTYEVVELRTLPSDLSGEIYSKRLTGISSNYAVGFAIERRINGRKKFGKS